ncbi:dachshund a [Cololabis saira]|uniref:dachshund a n=1 Tax=Cololabis saira TaxID=129043 RepID=UPI002AD52101|nr:dachshund a [Cololabis saira]
MTSSSPPTLLMSTPAHRPALPLRPSHHSSPSPSSSSPSSSDCRLVDVQGASVASFTVDGAELICLPQVFELFLKHLVGGLHTVYTKLKRLDIRPAVCTVEQVRALRGLGAIQPGVNRCKLIRRADFHTLYEDCATASSRPGRPPKRTLGVTNLTDGSRLLPHSLLSPALLPQTGLTAAVAMAEALKLQKMRMRMHFHGSSNTQQQSETENDDAGLSDLPFMVMSHPLLPVGLPPASVAMAMDQMSQLRSLANMAATPQTEETKDSVTRNPAPSEGGFHPQQRTNQSSCRESSCSSSSSPAPEHTQELDGERPEPDDRDKNNEDDCILPLPLLKLTNDKLPSRCQSPSVNNTNTTFAPVLLAEGLSSMETLLTNVQSLLKVAMDCTRSQNKQKQLERAELKLELDQERDVRQTLQRQLSSELQTRALMQRRLKKEKRAKRRLQEALDFESRRREEVEQTLELSESFTGVKKACLFSDAVTPERKQENHQRENTGAHGNQAFIKPLLF